MKIFQYENCRLFKTLFNIVKYFYLFVLGLITQNSDWNFSIHDQPSVNTNTPFCRSDMLQKRFRIASFDYLSRFEVCAEAYYPVSLSGLNTHRVVQKSIGRQDFVITFIK